MLFENECGVFRLQHSMADHTKSVKRKGDKHKASHARTGEDQNEMEYSN